MLWKGTHVNKLLTEKAKCNTSKKNLARVKNIIYFLNYFAHKLNYTHKILDSLSFSGVVHISPDIKYALISVKVFAKLHFSDKCLPTRRSPNTPFLRDSVGWPINCLQKQPSKPPHLWAAKAGGSHALWMIHIASCNYQGDISF